MYRMIKTFRQLSRPGLLTGLLLFCLLSNSWAAESIEKVFINADHMLLNIESGSSVYSGNVKISQGTLILTGDKLTLEQSNGEIKRLTVTGKPARYSHVTETGENIEAESEHMVYITSQNKLVMTINARLQQPEHEVSSQKIIYDTQNKIIIAGDKNGSSSADAASDTTKEKQRVKITLTPKKQLQPLKEPQAEE